MSKGRARGLLGIAAISVWSSSKPNHSLTGIRRARAAVRPGWFLLRTALPAKGSGSLHQRPSMYDWLPCGGWFTKQPIPDCCVPNLSLGSAA